MTQAFISRPDFDVVVVGARCAGAGTALNLARGGARVLVIDRDLPGSDTLSTHALMRAGVTMLDNWGILPRLIAEGTPAIRHTSFRYGAQTMAVQVRPRGGAEGLYAPRRHLLDRVLVEAARDAGAEFRYRTSLEEVLCDDNGRVTGVRLRDEKGAISSVGCGLLVGADGRASSVARMVGAKTYKSSERASGAVYGYFDADVGDGFRWVYKPGRSGGIIPTNDGQFCAFGSASRQDFKQAFGADPNGALAGVFAETDPDVADVIARGSASPLRRFAGAPSHLKQAFGAGWALVGDAGYFKDPCTAHGITDALRDADALARAILSNGQSALAEYQATRDALSMDLYSITDAMAGHDWTLPELQKLHFRLSDALKDEQAFVEQETQPLAA